MPVALLITIIPNQKTGRSTICFHWHPAAVRVCVDSGWLYYCSPLLLHPGLSPGLGVCWQKPLLSHQSSVLSLQLLSLSLPLCRLCPSYPQQLLVPAWITDKELENVAAFRSWKRIPAVVYRLVCLQGRGLKVVKVVLCPGWFYRWWKEWNHLQIKFSYQHHCEQFALAWKQKHASIRIFQTEPRPLTLPVTFIASRLRCVEVDWSLWCLFSVNL